MSRFLKTAISYAKSGIPCFPCRPNSKQPATKNGFLDATLDIETINKWWTDNPNYNIAIYPEPAGLAVVDEEHDSDGAWIEGELPLTFTQRTPRGGRHLFFEGHLASTVRKLGSRTDTRGSGGYVLVAPSVVDGKPYTIEHNVEIAPLPDWIPAKLGSVRLKNETSPGVGLDLSANVIRAVAYLAGLAPAIMGAGSDDAAFKAVAALRELGLSDGKTFDVMREHFRCDPLDDDWLHQKVANGFKFAQNAQGASAVGEPAQVFSQAVAPLLAPQPEKRSRFHPEDDDEMDQTPAARWLVKDVLQEGSTCMIYGPTQSYKSFVAIDLALAIATGKETFGQQPSVSGPVFYGALEGRADIKRTRRPAWRLAKGIEGKTDFYVLPAPMLVFPEEVTEVVEQIRLKCAGRTPRLVVLDTVSKMMVGLDATHDAPKLVRFCEGLTEAFPGVTVIAIHHSGHDVDKGPRDSSVYRAGFDTVLQVTSPAKRVCEVKVIKHKDSDEPENPFTFQLHPIGKSLVIQPTSAEEHAKLTHKEEDDSAFSRKRVGAALLARGAKGEAKGVGTRILAMELLPHDGNETPEAHEHRIKNGMAKLNRLTKTTLAAYFSGQRWHMPADEDTSSDSE